MQQYRPDIDGLRMVAVVPVVLFHAGVPMIGGGYVGVDVFFVISGFLITSIIKRELDDGRFSLLTFYERRARRILPALAFMVALTIAVSTLALLPTAME
ncbi:MAG: acyltransferase, partial [Hoeflea sp.]